MKQIKFSSNYPKLHNQSRAILFSIKKVNYDELHKDLIEYDTKNTKGEHYPLPRTILIHLTFLGDKLIPFCTLRMYTVEKYVYYNDACWDTFEIIKPLE